MDLYDENIARLIRHSLTGELSEQERVELEAWLRDSEEHQVLFEKIKKEIRISSESSLFRSLSDRWLGKSLKLPPGKGKDVSMSGEF